MKAAVVTEIGKAPMHGDFQDPLAEKGEGLVSVRASALSNLTRVKAAGRHYTSTPPVPFVPGVDGVGHLDDGRRVYFFMARPPFGAMAERAPVALSDCVSVPDALKDVEAAALPNPAMSSMAALRFRARFEKGETVLINGATGVSGRLAVQIARVLGAGRIIVTGRNAAMLETLKTMGADESVSLLQEEKALEENFSRVLKEGHVDVVLDYLWGKSVEAFIGAVAKGEESDRAIRLVQIGPMGGATITLPAAVLRSRALSIMGSGIGSVSTPDILASIREVFDIAATHGLTVDTQTAPLSEVENVWDEKNGNRLVLTL